MREVDLRIPRYYEERIEMDVHGWRDEHFQSIVLRGLYWAAGREPK